MREVYGPCRTCVSDREYIGNSVSHSMKMQFSFGNQSTPSSGEDLYIQMMEIFERIYTQRTNPMSQQELIVAFEEIAGRVPNLLDYVQSTGEKYVLNRKIHLGKRLRMCFVLKLKLPFTFEEEIKRYGELTLFNNRTINTFYSSIASIPTCNSRQKHNAITYDSGYSFRGDMPPVKRVQLQEEQTVVNKSNSDHQLQSEVKEEVEEEKPRASSSSETHVPMLDHSYIGSETSEPQMKTQKRSSDGSTQLKPTTSNPSVTTASRKRGIEAVQEENGFQKRIPIPLPQIDSYFYLYGITSWLEQFESVVLKEFCEKLKKALGSKVQELNSKRMDLSLVKRNIEFILDTIKNQRKREFTDEGFQLKVFIEKLEEFTHSFQFFSPIFAELIDEFRGFDNTDMMIPTKIIVHSFSFLITEHDLF
uniref:SPK domain-containing protein n=1 Tax=Caenorhabditis tropicalis TaxID=1561998 RepID=A0A1I7TT94_9PELO